MFIRPYHKQKKLLFVIVLLSLFVGVILLLSTKQQQRLPQQQTQQIISGEFDESKFKTEEEWKKILSPEQYHILREKGTEIPFTGELNNEKRKGTYYSVGCDKPIFHSEQKYDSGTGWPSFWAPISDDVLVLRKEPFPDDRIEVLDTCGNHLGHVFDDGPTTLPDGRQATGKRYCMNSKALRFVPDSSDY